MAVRGIDSLRSPLLGPSMGLAPAGPTQALFKNAPGVFVGAARLLRARSVQLAAPVVEPRSGVLIPGGEYKEKARTCVQALISNMAVRGIDSLRSPLLGPSMGLALRGQRRRCSKTLPAFLSGQPAYCVRGLSNWLRQLSNPGRGFSSPCGEYKEKSPYFRTGSHLEYGGEGDSNPDTLPYTHFPGVLLQPLGHLTILSFPLLSGTGANVGKYVSPVNQLLQKSAFRQTSSNLLLKRAKSVFCRQ